MSIGKSKILEKNYRAVDRDYLPLFIECWPHTRTTYFCNAILSLGEKNLVKENTRTHILFLFHALYQLLSPVKQVCKKEKFGLHNIAS